MSNWIFRVFCVASAIVFFQCAARKTQTPQNNVSKVPDAQVSEPQPLPTEEARAAEEEKKMVAAAESLEPGATREWLVQGKEILNKQCGSCHKAKDPMNYDEANWVRHMSRMIPKAKLTEEQAKYLRVYSLSLFRVAK